MKKKGFTLIELISVLVILAVLALIVTPLVMNIVKKAKISADKRSVDAYGKSVELAVAGYLMDYGKYPSDLSSLTVEYSGSEVACGVMNLNEDGSIYLSECSVKGREVKEDANDDGWYHFGKSSTTGYQTYSVGDQVTYNGVDYYVIENSDESMSTVHLLKAEPLTYEETTTYGSTSTYKTTNGYGGAYFDSIEPYSNDYSTSEIKGIVDAWADVKTNSNDLAVDSTGYKARLLSKEELITNLGYEIVNNGSVSYTSSNENVPSFVYNNGYDYWTLSPYDESTTMVWYVHHGGTLYGYAGDHINVKQYDIVVRPVINIKKSAL